VDELVDQARFPDPRFADQGHHLAVPRLGPGQHLLQGHEFRLPPDKARQSPGGSRLQTSANGARLDQLEHVDGFRQPLDRYWPQGIDPHQPFHQPQGSGAQQDAPRRGKLFHARRQVGGLANGRVVHVQVVANTPHHHLAGVEPHPDLHR
jgi:hypothetical protein